MAAAPSKAPTGIQGLDEITGGGLPAGLPTLICGTAGCGKTMLAMEFLVHGATQLGEPGVFMMFEENAAELSANVRSLGFDLEKLAARNKILLDYVHIERCEIDYRESGFSWRRSAPLACTLQKGRLASSAGGARG